MAWTAPRTWVVGEVVTAAQLNTHLRDNLLALRPEYIIKAADESVANSTMQDDNDFFFDIAANESMLIQMTLAMFINGNADFKCEWTFPSGADGWWAWSNPSFGSGTVIPLADEIVIGTGGSTESYVNIVTLVENGSTPGTMQYRWAQFNTDGANADRIDEGSFLTITRVAAAA